MIAAKHFDMVVGVDVHIILIPTPGGPVPTPIPHPFVGMMFDPDDYDLVAELANVGLDIQPMLDLKSAVESKIAEVQDGMDQFSPKAQVNKLIDKAKAAVTDKIAAAEQALTDALGIEPGPSGHATVKINGLPRSHITSKGIGMPPHIPIGGPFQKPPPNECEAFLGSMTVNADKEHLCFLGCMAKSCQDTSEFPNSTIIAVPKGMPVMVGGAPVPSLNQLKMKAFAKLKGAAKKAFGKALEALKKTKLAKAVSQKIHSAAGKAMDKLGIPADSVLRNQVHDKICETTGHPVVIATGRVFTEQVDFNLPGPIPLQWSRKWNSTSRYQGPFGYGWHGNYDLSLAYEGDAVVVRMADGRPVIFPPVRIGEHFTNLYENLTLIREETAFLLNDAGLHYRFELRSNSKVSDVLRLTCIETKSGHKLQFSYNTKGHLSGMVDSGGRQLAVHTDDQGRITSIDAPHPDKEGETFTIVSYAYDEIGNLVKDIDALGKPFTYAYQQHLLVKETNRNGLSFHFEYDGADDHARCIRTWGDGGIYDHKLNYNLEEKWTKVEDSLGNISTYHWNDAGVNWKIIDPLENEKLKTYTGQNKVQSEINELGLMTTYGYDDSGNQIAIYYPDGSTIELQYDEYLLVGATDQIDGSWVWEYDEHHQLTKRIDCLGRVTEYQYDGGNLKTMIDPAGGQTQLEYDETTNLTKLTYEDGESVKWHYDKLGRPLKTFDQAENVQCRVYNDRGWVTRVDEPDGNVRHLKYDAAGNVIHVRDNHHNVRFEYRDMNRLRARTEAGTRVEFKYDTEGNLLGIINEHGYAYRFELDKNFRVVVEAGFDGITHIYSRDAVGRVVQVNRASGIDTKYVYDQMDNVTRVKHSDGSFEIYNYRSDGELSEASNDHIEVKFERDGIGRILNENQGEFFVQSQYHLLGLRTEVKSSLGAHLTFGRNMMGDLENVHADGSTKEWEANFKRDQFGLELERSLPGGVRSEWTRDRLGRPIEQKTYAGGGHLDRSRTYVWDVNSRLKQIADSKSGITRFEHDVFGNLVGANYGDGTSELRMHDTVGNLFRSKNRSDRKYGPAGQLLHAKGTNYEYDLEGNLIKKIEQGGSTWQYDWNASGMLRSVIRPDGDMISFTYDALGRRLSKTYQTKVTRWVWDSNNMLHEWIEEIVSNSARPKRFSIQENKRIQINPRAGQLTTSPTHAPPQIASAVSTGSDKTFEAIANERTSQPTSPFIGDLTTWVFEPGRYTPLAKLCGEKQYSIITDHLGTPSSMYDLAGDKVWQMDLSIYGNVRHKEVWKEDCHFRFPGQYEDVETGLFYNRFRYYDSGTGSYISKDPLGPIGNVNSYSYVHDPLTWIDVSGLVGKECTAKTAEGEISNLPTFSGKKKADIQNILEKRGYTKVSSHDGTGEVWTKPMPDDKTAAVRIDEGDPTLPEGFKGREDHAHKEVVKTEKVEDGNYKHPWKTYDDDGQRSKDPTKTHITPIE